jgi:hypothetical protein
MGVFTLLGIVMATLSVISIIQHWGNFTLAETTNKVVQYYRSGRDVAKWVIFDWWIDLLWPGIVFAGWAMDILSIWAISVLGALRGNEVFRQSGVSRSVGAVGRGHLYTLPMERHHLVLLGPYGLALLVMRMSKTLYTSFPALQSGKAIGRREVQKLERDVQKLEGIDRHVLLGALHSRMMRRIALASLGAAVAPLLCTVLFFIWNAVDL